MPEGPDITRLSKHIIDELHDFMLHKIDILSGRYSKTKSTTNKIHLLSEFSNELPLKLNEIIRKGKVMIFTFENDWYIVVHFGLTGWFRVDDNNSKSDIVFKFENSHHKEKSLVYTDQLSFGTISIYNNKDDITKILDTLAPDIGDDLLDWSEFYKRVTTILNLKKAVCKKPVEYILSEQNILVSGIGNYLKAEILYDAQVDPHRIMSTLSEEEWHSIYKSIKKQNEKFIKTDIYNNPVNKQIYKKTIDPDGNPVESYKTPTKRTMYWVPNIQN